MLAQEQQRDQESKVKYIAHDDDEMPTRGQADRLKGTMPDGAQPRSPFCAARRGKVFFAPEQNEVEHAVNHAEHEYGSGDLQTGPAYEIQQLLSVHASPFQSRTGFVGAGHACEKMVAGMARSYRSITSP